MKHRTLALAALALACSARGGAAQELPQAKTIVDRYVQAIGGREAMARDNFRHVVTEMEMPAMGQKMTMDMKFARPNKFAVTMQMPGLGTMRSGFDGAHGWSVNPMTGPMLLEGKELEQLRRQADFDATANLATQYPTMQTVERSTANGEPCYRVRMVSAAQDTAFACFDVGTGLLSQMQMRQESQMGQMEAVVSFQDYRAAGGMKMPYKTVTQVMGQEMTMTVKSASTASIAPAEFEPPAEVKALIASRPGAPRQ